MFKIEASQANTVYKYQNIKIQLYKTIAHIKFNNTCIIQKITPKYATVYINPVSKAASTTKKYAEIFRIKQEIKSLYKKKVRLNKSLMKIHLQLLNQIHPAVIDNIVNKIDKYVSDIMRNLKRKQNLKIQKLISTQHPKSPSECKHSFYPCTVNLTNIVFDDNETCLLNKGLNYSIPPTHRQQIFNDIISAESAIKAITDPNTQMESRHLINNKFVKTLNTYNDNKYYTQKQIKARTEFKTVQNIKVKLIDNDALITKADKGHTLVIIDRNTYKQKVHKFILENNIETLNNDPTNSYTISLNKTINKCTSLLDEPTRRQLKPINARAPMLTGQPKLHKTDTPIRPLVNFTTAPGYKTAKKLATIIKENIVLNNNRTVINNLDFINKIRDIKISPNYKLASLDIVSLYTNVPVKQTIDILNNNLLTTKKLDTQKIQELILLLKTVLQQNYFTFDDGYYFQRDGLAMGSPLSGILADIYLNYYENNFFFNNNTFANNIIYYGRYVDDTFLIFNGSLRQLNNLKNVLNAINNNIQFTMETETENEICFLDLTVIKNRDNLKFKIYRKPTTTDVIIHDESHHPYPQKLAAYNSLIYLSLIHI